MSLPIESLILVALVSFCAASGAILFLRQHDRSRKAAAAFESGFISDGCVLLFSGTSLVAASQDARDMLTAQFDGGTVFDSLTSKLEFEDGDAGSLLNGLVMRGEAFCRDVTLPDGTFCEIEGRPRGDLAAIYIRDISTDRLRLDHAEALLKVVCNERDSLLNVINAAPLAIWRRAADGTLIWGNTAARMLVSQATRATGPGRLPANFLTGADGGDIAQKRRVSVRAPDGSERVEDWFELTEARLADDEVAGFATSSNEIVGVEAALRRFVATLTETFAHLPTGLAIFDGDRRLSIFNPALSDLMRIDVGWLARQPGYRVFMEKLREGQMMPEEKDTATWRERVQDIEAAAIRGSLSETWVLPSGQTLQITGKPHPHGSMVLLFEDISSSISMEQRYRSKMELSQVTLDYLSESVCVFDTTGAMVFSNVAFRDLWKINPAAASEPPSIVDITAVWGEACTPTPAWGDLREFVTRSDQRTSWTADIELTGGQKLLGVFAPLPDGSTLTVFADVSSDAGRESQFKAQLSRIHETHETERAIMELAVDHMREAVDLIMASAKAQPAPAGGFVKLDPSVVTDTVDATDRLMSLRRDGQRSGRTTEELLSEDLEELLEGTNTKVALSWEDIRDTTQLPGEVKRLMINMMLAVRSLVVTQSHVDVTVAEIDGATTVSCMFRTTMAEDAEVKRAAGLPLRILERFVEDQSGQTDVAPLGPEGLVKITATIPIRVADKQVLAAEAS